MRRIGVLMSMVESDPRGLEYITAFAQGLAELGWATQGYLSEQQRSSNRSGTPAWFAEREIAPSGLPGYTRSGFDVGRPNDFAPLLRFFGDALSDGARGMCQSRGGVVMPFFGKWRRKDIYQNSEDRTPTTLTNYFLNVTLRHQLCSKSFVAIPEKGGSTCASRRRQSRPRRRAF